MKLLLLLNEARRGSHDDIYSALDELKKKGELAEYQVIPFLAYINEGKSTSEILQIINSILLKFQADLILWSHTNKLKFTKEKLSHFRRQYANAIMGYWDGDIYQSPYKKLPRNIIDLCKFCDIIFCQGFGSMTTKLKKAGCQDIRYVPAATSPQRFKEAGKNRKLDYDVVMIGNNIIRKIPFLTMPGTRLRKQLVDRFYQEFGEKFAVFGAGWNGPFAKGILPFVDQAKAYYRGRLILGCNNLHAPYYFSNRLPIALASGVPVLYHAEKGVDRIFPPDTPVWFENVDEAVIKAKEMLRKSQDELDKIGKTACNWVNNHMTFKHTFSYMIKAMSQHQPMRNNQLKNPWLERESESC
jgi:hypothetical protein